MFINADRFPTIRVCLHWSEQLICTVNWLFSIKQMWFCRLIAVLQQSQQLQRNFCFRPMRFWLDCVCRQQQICNLTQFITVIGYIITNRLHIIDNLTRFYCRLIADWLQIVFFLQSNFGTSNKKNQQLASDPTLIFKATILKATRLQVFCRQSQSFCLCYCFRWCDSSIKRQRARQKHIKVN